MTKPLLRRLAEEIYGAEVASKIWKRIDLCGDIAIIKVPFGMSPEALRPLAERLLKELPYLRSVWAAVSPVEGPFRLREYVHLAGEPRSETMYKEHGCLFKVDIRRVYVSPRLNYEHMRVARLVRPGEVVVNMYAGAGLFSIIIAKHSKPRVVYSIDINPDAYRMMVENVKLNKLEGVVIPILGDAAEVVRERLKGTADRVLMPLPELALEHLPYAVEALRKGCKGFIHVYLHVHARKGENPLEKAAEQVGSRMESISGVKDFNTLFARVVRSVGPRWYQVVVDLEVETY